MGQLKLAVEDLERAGYHTVVLATPDTQGRPVGRQLPLRQFLDDPEAGVEVSSCVLVYDLAGIPVRDSKFAGAQTGYHDIRLSPDLRTLRPYPGLPGTAICLADRWTTAEGRSPLRPARYSPSRSRRRDKRDLESAWQQNWSSISS